MKTMTCNQLGGACNERFSAETFEEMGELSKEHGMRMHQENDKAHLEAMAKMRELMKDPTEMQKWFDSKRIEFDAMPDD